MLSLHVCMEKNKDTEHYKSKGEIQKQLWKSSQSPMFMYLKLRMAYQEKKQKGAR